MSCKFGLGKDERIRKEGSEEGRREGWMREVRDQFLRGGNYLNCVFKKKYLLSPKCIRMCVRPGQSEL